MVLVHIYGRTDADTTDSGLIMICKVLVYIFMLMESDMMGSTRAIRRKDTDCIIGLMAGDTKAGGTKASSMDLELI